MLASDVGVIRGGYQAHGLRRAGKHVAESVGDPLDFVGLEVNLIVADVVVGRASGAMHPAVCWHRFLAGGLGRVSITHIVGKSEIAHGGDAEVHYSTR